MDPETAGPSPGPGESATSSPLIQLLEHGQSYWLDNLTRGMIRSGELERRVREEGLRGMTSNPSIFQKAITAGEEYDAEIEELVRSGASVAEIYERLTVSDIRGAADVLRPVYDQSGGVDGYVSLEVSPYLVHDTDGSLREARRLFEAVDRPNVFIKIPGSPAGVPAIEEALFEGIPINITLLFSIGAYDAVAEAYTRALERRLEAGKRVDDVASVASFFLSRIDVLVDRLLGHRIDADRVDAGRIEAGEAASAPGAARPAALLGKAAIANAKLAYKSFVDRIASERWKALAAEGARPQRVLWASTSTKDPLYGDVRYVEPLIGPHTVNTMPDKTIRAFADHGRVATTVEDGMDEARGVMGALERVGIDFERATDELLDEAVQKFIDPYDSLLATLARRRDEILADRLASQTLSLGDSEKEFGAICDALDQRQLGRRLFAGDPLLWTNDPSEAEKIRDRLGWLRCVSTFTDRLDEIRDFAASVRADGIRRVALLGMGGSSLCPDVCARIFGSANETEDGARLYVLDDTDPVAIRALEERLDPATTLWIVASKSGTTTETLSFYRYFFERAEAELGKEAARRFVAITDPGTPLAREAADRGFRHCFENPPDIGGRYSALSYFGLVPMALLGMDADEVLADADAMLRSCGPYLPAAENPGLALGAVLGGAARRGRDKLTLEFSSALAPLGDWIEQLIAESTGKDGRGIVPVVGEPPGDPDAYGDDRLFVHVALEEETNAETEARLEALVSAGHPVVRIRLDDPLQIGGEFVRWEIATATAGVILGVNPFDEPNVAESKRNTRELLERWESEGGFDERKPAARDERAAVFTGDGDAGGGDAGDADGSPADIVRDFLGAARPGDYIAFLPYERRTPGGDEPYEAGPGHRVLRDFRGRLRDELGIATLLGHGPRYLHSTGQLHKGGPPSGLFVMLTTDREAKLPIPGEPYGFAVLHHAQALGDFRSLVDHGRRVLRIHLAGEVKSALEGLLEGVEAAETKRETIAT